MKRVSNMDIVVKKNKEDIEAALGLLNHDKNFLRTSKYNMIYQHTNEELDYYMSKFPIRDGKVLTVAASGDQTLQAISLGAREVTTFDINKFTYYFTYLKYVASCVLEYDEFIKYFGYFTLANNNFHNLVNKIDDSFGIEIY